MTEPTMRERVARAIADANMEDFDELPDLHLAMADAAIGAMRDAPSHVIDVISSRVYDDLYPRGIWENAIDAVLAEKP